MQAPRAALQQLHAQPCLQPRHALADSRGRDTQVARSGREAAALGDQDQHFQLGKAVGIGAARVGGCESNK